MICCSKICMNFCAEFQILIGIKHFRYDNLSMDLMIQMDSLNVLVNWLETNIKGLKETHNIDRNKGKEAARARSDDHHRGVFFSKTCENRIQSTTLYTCKLLIWNWTEKFLLISKRMIVHSIYSETLIHLRHQQAVDLSINHKETAHPAYHQARKFTFMQGYKYQKLWWQMKWIRFSFFRSPRSLSPSNQVSDTFDDIDDYLPVVSDIEDQNDDETDSKRKSKRRWFG